MTVSPLFCHLTCQLAYEAGSGQSYVSYCRIVWHMTRLLRLMPDSFNSLWRLFRARRFETDYIISTPMTRRTSILNKFLLARYFPLILDFNLTTYAVTSNIQKSKIVWFSFRHRKSFTRLKFLNKSRSLHENRRD